MKNSLKPVEPGQEFDECERSVLLSLANAVHCL